jgi:hypothetical protein
MARLAISLVVILGAAFVFVTARGVSTAAVTFTPDVAPTTPDVLDGASPVAPVTTSPAPVSAPGALANAPATKPDRKGDWMGETWVEHGTPPECLKSYIEGYRPVKILADGTQVFENMPGKVRNAQGVLEERKVTISVNPTKPVPVDAAEAGR